MPEREATPKQKALLGFIGMPFQEPLSSADASRMIDEAINSDSYRDRLDGWNHAKLKLHPDLYADEIASQKASRADGIYYEVTDEIMRDLLNRVTKAEVRQVVAYLDEHAPGWDDDSAKRIFDYFLPALQRVFPKRVKKGYTFNFPSAKPAQKPSAKGCLVCLCTLIIFLCLAYSAFNQ